MSVDLLPGSPDNPQSLDRYNYVLDDPVNLVDPLGLDCKTAGTDPATGLPIIRCEVTGTDPGGHFVDIPGACTIIFKNGVLVSNSCYGGAGGLFGGRGKGGDIEPPNIRGPIPGGNADLSKLVGPAKQPENPCPVTAQSLNAYLQSKGSPLAGQGNGFLNAGKTYNVDPRFIVAIAGAETSFGRNITWGQYNAWNWGWNVKDRTNSPFSSWGAGINSVTAGIAGKYYFQAGLTTTASIYPRYCQGPDCLNGLRNINIFLRQQGGDSNSLNFPCK